LIQRTLLFSAIAVLFTFTLSASAQLDEANRQLSRDIFKQLIEINTTDSVGNVTTAAEAMAKRLLDAGFPASDVQVLGPNERKKNLVVRYHGSGKHKPMLMIGHLDVVEAKREDWTTDPFQFVEKDGYFYGRGTQDMKDGDAEMVTTLLRFKKEGYVPDRDIIMALTADEEGGNFNGPDWLIKNHRELVDADFVLNLDSGGVLSDHGKPMMLSLGASEKLYGDFHLTVTNPGGHSSLPRPENAIYQLAEGLVRISKYQFPFELNNVTREYYARSAKIESGQRAADMLAILKDPPDMDAIARLSKDPIDNSTTHTTCVATRLSAGHANNALPQRAEANVNCRILPGHPLEEIRLQLARIVDDPKIQVSYVGPEGKLMEHAEGRQTYAPPPLRSEVMGPLEKVTQQMWPGLPIIPNMATGASDSIYTNGAGMVTYGISGDAIDRDDVRAHGRDERLGVESFYTGMEFFYRYLKALTSQ